MCFFIHVVIKVMTNYVLAMNFGDLLLVPSIFNYQAAFCPAHYANCRTHSFPNVRRDWGSPYAHA